jgi:hypothetical protein
MKVYWVFRCLGRVGDGQQVVALVEQLSWDDFLQEATWRARDAEQSLQEVDAIQYFQIQLVL